MVKGASARYAACCAEPITRMERVAETRIHIRQCCRSRTGRMHQIHVYLAHLGHPLVGNKIYGGDERNYLDFIDRGRTPEPASRLILPRHALHACRLTFPRHGTTIAVESPLPADMAALMKDA